MDPIAEKYIKKAFKSKPSKLRLKNPIDWFIEYIVKDEEGNIKRVKYRGGLNRIKNLTDRKRAAVEMKERIDRMLVLGYKKMTVKKDILDEFSRMSLIDAVNFVLERKKNVLRKSSMFALEALKAKIDEFNSLTGAENFKLKKVSQTWVQQFLEYLQLKYHIGNKTYNNYLISLGTIFNFIIKRDNTVFRTNPAGAIDKLPTSTQMHQAYSPDDLKKLREEMTKTGQGQLLLFVSFIFYTLARPNEIEQIRVCDIDLVENKIYIPASSSKNKKSNFIALMPPLKEMIDQYGIMNYPAQCYIFSICGTPGEKPVYDKYFWKKHTSILKSCGMDLNGKKYDLYGYKHSGAINLYLSGVDIIDIQRQCRHKTLDQTMVYLRELDSFRTNNLFNNIRRPL